ncbi:hypothetical protein XCR_0849 [Xanthomonas campestris pv. raphani 756C]|nr:hypothetical protein XCR_0849 [Xanthomonas campestris pv. raphani 756C]
MPAPQVLPGVGRGIAQTDAATSHTPSDALQVGQCEHALLPSLPDCRAEWFRKEL